MISIDLKWKVLQALDVKIEEINCNQTNVNN